MNRLLIWQELPFHCSKDGIVLVDHPIRDDCSRREHRVQDHTLLTNDTATADARCEYDSRLWSFRHTDVIAAYTIRSRIVALTKPACFIISYSI
jgi:hypothetical protein